MTLDTEVLHSEEATEVLDDSEQSTMKDEMDIAQDLSAKRTNAHASVAASSMTSL